MHRFRVEFIPFSVYAGPVMRLEDYLKRHKMTQTQFSELSGVTLSRVNAICKGEGSSASTAYQIMLAAPEVTLIDLMGDAKREALARIGLV